jgi:murein L,D-transpeptidase YafK
MRRAKVPRLGGIALIRAALVRALVLSAAAFAGALTPVRCLGEDGNPLPTKATKELSPELLSLLQQKHMVKNSPILVRIFKEESELEVWKQDATGRFQILKIYPICRWSGDLGPKLHEGDRQAPEGFYTIAPQLMNPNSNYYLAINIGFPNSFDKANGRDGNFLMIHGDCSSSGCYAMTDEQMDEVYSLARESLLGRPSFQIQAYPFRLTPANLARHRTNPHMAFWKMLKIGNDHFEATHLEPKVDVCNRRYVFDADQPPDSSQPLVFDPTSKCPAFVVNPKIARPALAKQHADEVEYARLVKDNVSVAPIYSGLDGGMNTVFVARFPGKIIPLAIVLPPTGSGLPQLPPIPWADNDGSSASKFFGALFESKPVSRTQVASTVSATQEPGVNLTTTNSTPMPTTKPAPEIETVVAAKPKSSEPDENPPANTEAPRAELQETAAMQSDPVPQQEGHAAAPLASDDNTKSALPMVPADSFVSRWGGLR